MRPPHKNIQVLGIVALAVWGLAMLYANSQLPSKPISSLDRADDEYYRRLDHLIKLQEQQAGRTERAAAHRDLGLSMLSQQRGEQAEMEFGKYLSLTEARQDATAEDLSRCFCLIGSYYLGLKQFEGADRYYQRALQHDLVNNSGGVGRDMNDLGLLYYIWGQTFADAEQRTHYFQTAKKYFGEAMERSKNGPNAPIISANYNALVNEMSHDKPIY